MAKDMLTGICMPGRREYARRTEETQAVEALVPGATVFVPFEGRIDRLLFHLGKKLGKRFAHRKVDGGFNVWISGRRVRDCKVAANGAEQKNQKE